MINNSINRQYQREKDILKFHKSLKSISHSASQHQPSYKDFTDMRKLYKTIHSSNNKIANGYSKKLDNRMKSLNNTVPASTVQDIAVSFDNDLNQNDNLHFVKRDVKGFENQQKQLPNFNKNIISHSNTYRGKHAPRKPLKHKPLRLNGRNNGRHFGQSPSPAIV